MVLNAEQSRIKLALTFPQQLNLFEIKNVVLKVKRTNQTAGCYDGFVCLDPAKVQYYQEEAGSDKVTIISNLGELKEEDKGKDFYKLSRDNGNEKNKFFLTVEVQFSDKTSTCDTRSFLVFNAKSTTAVKRRRVDNDNAGDESPISVASSGIASNDSYQSGRILEVQKAYIEEVEAKLGRFDNLTAKVLKTGNGDIAYHFTLKDQDSVETFESGEIIGFSTNNKGKVVIQKLTSSIAENKEVFLKGVVTDSYYVEAFRPEDENVVTATICMLGIVPVLTLGPVYPGDGLYASKSEPGIATPEDYVPDRKNETLIGVSLVEDDCPDDEIRFVKALVSILGTATLDLVKKELNTLENSLKDNISNVSRRHKKRYYFISAFIMVFFFSLGIGLYQRYGIGTMYQRWACRQGSTGTSEYWYWLQGHLYRGVRFPDCKTVWMKATQDRRFYKRPRHIHVQSMKENCLKNGTYHYYINLDSCTGVLNPGARYMFAVDDNCTKVFRFDEVEGKWDIDRKVCARPRCNLFCSHTGENSENCEPNEKCYHDVGPIPITNKNSED